MLHATYVTPLSLSQKTMPFCCFRILLGNFFSLWIVVSSIFLNIFFFLIITYANNNTTLMVNIAAGYYKYMTFAGLLICWLIYIDWCYSLYLLEGLFFCISDLVQSFIFGRSLFEQQYTSLMHAHCSSPSWCLGWLNATWSEVWRYINSYLEKFLHFRKKLITNCSIPRWFGIAHRVFLWMSTNYEQWFFWNSASN